LAGNLWQQRGKVFKAQHFRWAFLLMQEYFCFLEVFGLIFTGIAKQYLLSTDISARSFKKHL